jgi:hypothetical protein
MVSLRHSYKDWKLTHLELARERLARRRRCASCQLFMYDGDELATIYLAGKLRPGAQPWTWRLVFVWNVY